MKKIIIISLVLFTVTSYSQENKKKFTEGLSIGFMFSPSYSYRTISTEDEYMQWAVDERERLEGKNPAYNLGFFAEKKFGKKLYFSFALQYRYYSFITDKTAFNSQEYPTVNIIRISYNYNYISSPLILRYNIIEKKNWDLFLNAGLSPNLFISYNQKHLFYENDNKVSTEYSLNSIDYNTFTVDIITGFGIKYKINEKFILGFAPVYNHSLISSIDSDIYEYLYKIGLRIKFAYSLSEN